MTTTSGTTGCVRKNQRNSRKVNVLTVETSSDSPSRPTWREGQGVQDLSNETSPQVAGFYAHPKDFTFICPTEIVEF
jgi:alkyl hydroperoxide reductase subunit AhpC